MAFMPREAAMSWVWFVAAFISGAIAGVMVTVVILYDNAKGDRRRWWDDE